MAGLFSPSYTAAVDGRQPKRSQCGVASIAMLVGGLAPMLAGCSGFMMPMSSWLSGEPPATEITGSIPKPTVAAPTPDSDSDVIRNTVAVAPTSEGLSLPWKPASAPVTWKNETSGNSGTISKLTAVKAVNGAACRDFETTLVTIDGVRLYRGRACQGYNGPWDLVRFEPTDPVNPG